MPLHTPTTTAAPHLPRPGRLAAVTVALIVGAGAGAVVLADSDPTPQVRLAPAGAVTLAPDYGLEVNKAASMQALSRHLAEQRVKRVAPFDDLQANRARNQAAR